MDDGRKFFVIGRRGECGPFDRGELAAELREGRITADDQVRNAFGRPLGTVSALLAPPSAARMRSPPTPAPRAQAPVSALLIAVVVLVVAAGGYVLLRPPPPPTEVPAATIPAPGMSAAPAPMMPAATPAMPAAPPPAASTTLTLLDIGGRFGPEPALGGLDIMLHSTGTDIWGSTDRFRMLQTAVQGDTAVEVRLDSLLGPVKDGKAGIMLRSGPAPDAPFAYLGLSLAGVLQCYGRPTAGAATDKPATARCGTPQWLRLERRGDTVTASRSDDGAAWTVVGKQRLPPGPAIAGLAMAGRHPASEARFTGLAVRPLR